MAFSDLVKEIIDLSIAAQEYWDRELPKRHPNYPLVGEGEDSGPPPAEEVKLENLLNSLPPEVIWKLLLIALIGRGDYKPDDLSGSCEAIKRRFETPEWALRQLYAMAPLGEELSDGMEKLKRHNIEVDRLLEKRAA